MSDFIWAKLADNTIDSVITPMVVSTSSGLRISALIGGTCYTVVVLFCVWKRLKFGHRI